ncbi:MAG: hypothetical protein KA508_06295 [Gammaproteobacteria bacterium]|nr:hypothetical protein [Gammaproteobacteria bacterium]
MVRYRMVGWIAACMLSYQLAPWAAEGCKDLFLKVDRQLAHYCLGVVSNKPSCFIHKKTLDQKLKQGLPAWAKAQIQEDLKPFKKIKKADIDRYADQYPQLARLQVKEGKFLVHPHPSDRYLIMKDVFEYLAKNHYIKEADLLLATADYFQPKEKPRLPVFVFAKDLSHPLEKDLVLIPDAVNLDETHYLRPMIRQAAKQYPWDSKKPMLFWRGAQNGTAQAGREALVLWSIEDPKRINACFTYLSTCFTTVRQACQTCEAVTPANHLQYKYLISLDGVRAAWGRLVWHLHSNSLTFKHDSQHWQWFYKGIQPGVHYRSMHDKKSLLEGMDWAEKNPEAAQKITQSASTFVEENLSLEDMYHYIIVLCQEYAKRLEAKAG